MKGQTFLSVLYLLAMIGEMSASLYYALIAHNAEASVWAFTALLWTILSLIHTKM